MLLDHWDVLIVAIVGALIVGPRSHRPSSYAACLLAALASGAVYLLVSRPHLIGEVF